MAEEIYARGQRDLGRRFVEIAAAVADVHEKFANEDAEREARDLDTEYSNGSCYIDRAQGRRRIWMAAAAAKVIPWSGFVVMPESS